MKLLFILLSLFLINCNMAATPAAAGQEKLYVVGVGFNSICCGPASDQFLKDFVKKFNKTNKVTIKADKIAGCGREGEYVVLFPMSKIKAATTKKFIAELEKIVPAREAKNKETNTSSGGLEVLHNVKISDYNHCRIKPQNWVY